MKHAASPMTCAAWEHQVPKTEVADELEFADVVREARETLGLDQPAFGDLMGVTRATVSRWERGFRPKASHGADIVTRLARTGLASPIQQALIDTLGLSHAFSASEPPAPTSPVPPATPATLAPQTPTIPTRHSTLEASVAIDHVVYAVAERHELTPRAVRDLLLDLIAHAQSAGLALDDVRKILLRSTAAAKRVIEA